MSHFFKWGIYFLSFLIQVIFTINTLNAQIEIGPVVGWQWSNMKFNSEVDQDNTIGYKNYFLGVSAKGSINHRLAFLAGGQYLHMGYRTNAMDQLYSYLRPGTTIILPDGREISYIDHGARNVTYRHQYLEMSSGLEYRLTPELSTGIGAYFGFRRTETKELANNEEPGHSILDVPQEVKEKDFGLSANMKLYMKKFYVIFRYQHGLNDFRKEDPRLMAQGGSSQLGQRRRNLSIGLGYYFTVLPKQ